MTIVTPEPPPGQRAGELVAKELERARIASVLAAHAKVVKRHASAVGDCSAFPLKSGGLAGEQTDVAAEQIAAAAGVDIQPPPLIPCFV